MAAEKNPFLPEEEDLPGDYALDPLALQALNIMAFDSEHRPPVESAQVQYVDQRGAAVNAVPGGIDVSGYDPLTNSGTIKLGGAA